MGLFICHHGPNEEEIEGGCLLACMNCGHTCRNHITGPCICGMVIMQQVDENQKVTHYNSMACDCCPFVEPSG